MACFTGENLAIVKSRKYLRIYDEGGVEGEKTRNVWRVSTAASNKHIEQQLATTNEESLD